MVRAWRVARAAGAVLVAAAVLGACGPSLEADLAPIATVTPAPSASPAPTLAVPIPTPTQTAGGDAFLDQLDRDLPGLTEDDDWKIQQADWGCLLLDSGLTLRGAATTTALEAGGSLTAAQATTLIRDAVPHYCPEHTSDVASYGTAPLDATLDGNGQGACFWLDYARYLNAGGHQDGDLTLGVAVFAAGVTAKISGTEGFRSAWLAMASDISTPIGLAERRTLCETYGWHGSFGGPLDVGASPAPGRTA